MVVEAGVGGYGSVAEAVAGLASLHASTRADVGSSPGVVLAEELAGIARARALLDCLEAVRLRAFDNRQEWRADLSASAASWLSQHLHLDPADAHARVRTARLLADLPATGAALEDGTISAAHVHAVAAGARRVGVEPFVTAEPALLELAGRARPRDVRVAVGRVIEAVGGAQSGAERAAAQRAARHLILTRGAYGAWTLDGLLDGPDGTLVESALDAFAGSQPLPDGTPDPRTPGARTADALVTIARMALDSPQAPQVHGAAPHLTLLLDLDTIRGAARDGSVDRPADLRREVGEPDELLDDEVPDADDSADRAGDVEVDHSGCRQGLPGSWIPEARPPVNRRRRRHPPTRNPAAPPARRGRRRSTARQLAAILTTGFGPDALARLTCNASVTPALLDRLGQPMALGRASRLATPAQTRLLWIRDGGCIAPGCTTRWVQVHHLVHWADGGTTDTELMCLLCERHHHLVHDDGWTVERHPQHPGRMRFRHPNRTAVTDAVHTIDRNPGATIPLPWDT